VSSRVLITGARGNLGRGLVAAFDENGWRVASANRSNPTRASQTELAEQHIDLDLTQDAQIEQATAQFFDACEEGDRVALVANASNREALATDWTDLSRETLHALFDVDVAGHFLLARAFARGASQRRCGATILFVGSIYGSGGVHSAIYPEGMRPTPVQYCVVKAAVVGLTKDLAGRLGPSGITVNCLVPGGIEGDQPKAFVRDFSALTQLGRMATASEVAAVAEMLCRAQSAYVTGQVIHVDGGWSAW
jgi:NAD(P)-dependent dehydrogenase (short-subunit alcohol dehydrogenase family)